ncbi:uncharacterized protein K441DRAFT_553107, partial [Cenococcum geophilum 1.58]|uniref:uncharacterized protein n=1 Tax=Cenococcum geophilum 1.58 TaxID=794803 RepID=UPI0035901CC1
ILKYIFYIKNIKFLGFIITPRGIIIDPTRVFLSFANFYRRFIWNYLDTVYPLYISLI